MSMRRKLLVSVAAALAVTALAGPVTAATASPVPAIRCDAVTPTKCCPPAGAHPDGNPGGDGSDYNSIPGGVYGWYIKAKHPFTVIIGGKKHTYKGWIYSGSTGSLRSRRSDWLSDLKKLIAKNGNFTFRVLSKDWDTSRFGKLPSGLTVEQVRLGAEQAAINSFAKWGAKEGYVSYNTNNAIGKGVSWRQKAIDAGMDLYENQLENDLPAGHGGDELNYGIDNIPPASYSGIEPGGTGC